MNLVLGAKVVWRLMTTKKDQWKRAQGMEYFGILNLQRIEHLHQEGKVSQAWRQCKVVSNIITGNLWWKPRNRKKIRLWEDKLLDYGPLEEWQNLLAIKHWDQQHNITFLFELVDWNMETSMWQGWKLEGLPPQFEEQKLILFTLFKGKAPFNHSQKDKRILMPAHGKYCVKKGYESFLQESPLPPISPLWNHIWHKDGLPKVKFFCCLLSHGKIITTENLTKRKIQGPSWCILCCNLEESIGNLL